MEYRGRHYMGICDKPRVIKRLSNREISLGSYHHAITHDKDCIKAALDADIIKGVDELPDDMVNKVITPEIIDKYWRRYFEDLSKITDEEQEEWTKYLIKQELKEEAEREYESYFPDYVAVQLAVQQAIKEGTDPVKAIISVVKYLSDDEYSNLRKELKSGSFAREFINPNTCSGNVLAIQTTIDVYRNNYRRLGEIYRTNYRRIRFKD